MQAFKKNLYIYIVIIINAVRIKQYRAATISFVFLHFFMPWAPPLYLIEIQCLAQGQFLRSYKQVRLSSGIPPLYKQWERLHPGEDRGKSKERYEENETTAWINWTRSSSHATPERAHLWESKAKEEHLQHMSVLNQCHLVLMCSPVAFLVSSDYKSYLFHHWQSPASNLQANQ